jgi:hypothetical protein
MGKDVMDAYYNIGAGRAFRQHIPRSASARGGGDLGEPEVKKLEDIREQFGIIIAAALQELRHLHRYGNCQMSTNSDYEEIITK